MKHLFIVFILSLFTLTSVCQNTSFKSKKYKSIILKPQPDTLDFNVTILNLEAPSPNGDSYKSFLLKQKIKSKKLFPYTKTSKPSNNKTENSSTSKPEILNSYGMMRYNSSNDTVPVYGGRPNDNSMAISNDGLMLLAINSSVQLYDTKNDSLLFPNEQLSLRNVFNLPFGNYYDPKIIYDKEFDRFVLVFLKNNSPSNNLIMVGFSKTNNPIDGWNVYSLPGNPLNNNRWTDFPTIALSDSSLFFTGNLIVPNVSWQVGFDGSILWEVKKTLGYNEALNIEPKLYYDIKFGANYVRNLHCVQGIDGNVQNLHMLSNRNFDIQNDTFFIVSLIEEVDTSYINIKEIISDITYGVPPNGRQADTDLSDPTEGLQTNDARVLGAIQFEDEIQFVSTCINTETGFASIYHGRINELNNSPNLTSNIISDNVKDYAYPNIAWTGNENCDRETIIAFNHTSITDYAGISAVYFDNEGNYSEVLELKKGENFVDRMNGGYERWGDYFGIQRKYNEPGKVFTFGFTTDNTKKNYGWINELQSPDTNTIHYSYTINSNGVYCEEQIEIEAFGGVPPYTVDWNTNSNNNSLTSDNYCKEDTISFTVMDSRACNVSGKVYLELQNHNNPFSLFPNPTNDVLAFQFVAEKDGIINVEIFDLKGSFMKTIALQKVKKGLNELNFSTEPLANGSYYVRVIDGSNKVLAKEKFIKK